MNRICDDSMSYFKNPVNPEAERIHTCEYDHLSNKFGGKENETLKEYQPFIQSTIETKITSVYTQLNPNHILLQFMHYIRENNLLDFEESPQHSNMKEFLDEHITHFLIQFSYFDLSGKYLLRILMKKTGITDPNDIRLLSICDYVREKIENDNLKKLKSFKEKCTFKTFLTTVIIRLFIDYFRMEKRTRDNESKYEGEMISLGLDSSPDPLHTLISNERDENEKAGLDILPEVLEELSPEERLAIKLKYEHGMKMSAIARTFDISRHHTLQLITRVEEKISTIIKKRIKNNGNDSNNKGGYL